MAIDTCIPSYIEFRKTPPPFYDLRIERVRGTLEGAEKLDLIAMMMRRAIRYTVHHAWNIEGDTYLDDSGFNGGIFHWKWQGSGSANVVEVAESEGFRSEADLADYEVYADGKGMDTIPVSHVTRYLGISQSDTGPVDVPENRSGGYGGYSGTEAQVYATIPSQDATYDIGLKTNYIQEGGPNTYQIRTRIQTPQFQTFYDPATQTFGTWQAITMVKRDDDRGANPNFVGTDYDAYIIGFGATVDIYGKGYENVYPNETGFYTSWGRYTANRCYGQTVLQNVELGNFEKVGEFTMNGPNWMRGGTTSITRDLYSSRTRGVTYSISTTATPEMFLPYGYDKDAPFTLTEKMACWDVSTGKLLRKIWGPLPIGRVFPRLDGQPD